MESLAEHWRWITGGPASALTIWLMRSRLSALWTGGVRILRANRRVTELEQEIHDRDRTITFLRGNLDTLMGAAELVDRARETGLIRTSAKSESAPESLPNASTPLPLPQASIPATRSTSPHGSADDDR